MSKNDVAWAKVFETLDVVDTVNKHKELLVSAKTLKEVGGEEPRLMAKIDTYKDLPKVMKESKIYGLAVANGLYKLTRSNPFIKIPDLSTKRIFPIKRMEGLYTLDLFKSTKLTESMVLDLANYNSLLADCCGEKVDLTLRGKRRGTFPFVLDDMSFDVNQVQIEVDGCFEGAKGVHIVEVKVDPLTNTTIRQLLYAKLMLESKLKGLKPVHTWLLMYDKKTEVFDFHKFVVEDTCYYFDYDQSKRYILK
ncbi:hypothetical protein JZU46_02840 [bacterium]|nr:hypothetical protein [bacterium]